MKISKTLPSVLLLALLLSCPTLSNSKEPPDYGAEWNRLQDSARLMFIEGFRCGQFDVLFDARECINDKISEEVVDKAAKFSDVALSNVMTSIYSDPANTYISFGAIFNLAQMKLEGSDIDKLLISARKIAVNISNPKPQPKTKEKPQ